MTRAFVTGGTGFIGRHLVRALDAAGVEVHVPTRAGSTRRPGLPDGVRVHRLERPSIDVTQVIEDVRPEIVYHLATHFSARHKPSEVADMVDSNVTLGTGVAQACTRTGARLVHTTSAWQHFGGAEYSPVSLYAATKQAFVDVLRYYIEVEGLDSREVCLFDTYGPDDDRGKLVNGLLSAAAGGTSLSMSSGSQLVDLTHVDDVVAGLRAAAASDQQVRRLVLRTGTVRTVRDVVRTVEHATGAPVAVTWGAHPDRPREMVEDWKVASDDIGWRATIELETGIRDLWQREFRGGQK